MRQMILLAAFVALVGRDCAAGDYKNVRFGPYTDSAQEASANGNLAPLVEDFRGAAAPQIFLTGRRRAFSFSEDMAGVSTISITGPYGVVYAQQFTPPVKSTGLAVYDLPAGPYYIRSYNSVGGLSVSMRLSVDGTPPVTTAALNGAELVLLAMDPVSNGLSSKVQSVFYALDAIPAGSRAAGIYTKPVELPPGKHMVYFFSMDKVGNMETVNSLPVNVPPHASKRK